MALITDGRFSGATRARLCEGLAWDGFLPDFASGGVELREDYLLRTKDIGKYDYGVYACNRMFYLNDRGQIVPVKHPDAITLDQLVDYELERNKLLGNTRALLAEHFALERGGRSARLARQFIDSLLSK